MRRFVKVASVVVIGTLALSALGALAVHDRQKDQSLDFVKTFALFMPITAVALLLAYRDYFLNEEDGCILGKEGCRR